jgi:hypothetical protein
MIISVDYPIHPDCRLDHPDTCRKCGACGCTFGRYGLLAVEPPKEEPIAQPVKPAGKGLW